MFWSRPEKVQLGRIVLAAKRLELATRTPGKRTGIIGHVGIEVVELLTNLVCRRTGRLDPSITFIMAKLRRSRDAVVRALAALRSAGLLDWIRRLEEVEADGPGPRVRQVSNAYRLCLPPRALRLLGIGGQDNGLPDDEADHRAARASEVEAMKAGLSLPQLVSVEVGDDRLRAMLSLMATRVRQPG